MIRLFMFSRYNHVTLESQLEQTTGFCMVSHGELDTPAVVELLDVRVRPGIWWSLPLLLFG